MRETVDSQREDLAQRLESARRQFADAQALARIGSWEWDIPANVVWWSDELFRIYGLEPGAIAPSYEDFLGRVHADDRASVDERNQRAFADHQPFEDVKRVVRVDGREILMRTQGDVVCDKAGAPLRMIGICEDVTDEVRARDAEQRLAAIDALRRRAGEINDQVIQDLVVAGFHLDRDEPAQAREALTAARRSAQRIATDLILDAGTEPGDLRRATEPSD
jgi:PAS domain S-box-containing protein